MLKFQDSLYMYDVPHPGRPRYMSRSGMHTYVHVYACTRVHVRVHVYTCMPISGSIERSSGPGLITRSAAGAGQERSTRRRSRARASAYVQTCWF